MAAWDELAAQMDEEVDAAVGDTIAYSVNGGVDYVDYPGFLIPFEQGLGLDGIDETLGRRLRVKLGVRFVPKVSRAHRLKVVAKMGEQVYQPIESVEANDGRYNVFDIQKV